MDNEKNKYGYSLEEQMAWQSSQNKDLERRGIFDSGAGVNEPEEWLSQKSGPANEENAIDLAILHDWSEKKAVERENLYSEVRKFESEQAKAKKELDAFNKMTSYEKLYDALYHYARYLSKNKNNIKDVEVSKKIVSAMVSAKNGNFDEMENLFAFLQQYSNSEPYLADALPEWQNYFHQWQQEVENIKKKKFEEAKTEYKKSNFLSRLISKLKGEKLEILEEGKKK